MGSVCGGVGGGALVEKADTGAAGCACAAGVFAMYGGGILFDFWEPRTGRVVACAAVWAGGMDCGVGRGADDVGRSVCGVGANLFGSELERVRAGEGGARIDSRRAV